MTTHFPLPRGRSGIRQGQILSLSFCWGRETSQKRRIATRTLPAFVPSNFIIFEYEYQPIPNNHSQILAYPSLLICRQKRYKNIELSQMEVLQTHLISFKELPNPMSNNFKVGKLKFKEGVAKPVYIPKKSKKQEEEDKQEEVDLVQEDKLITYEPKPGTGTITSSGRTIHGSETKFREELEKGDSIIIVNPIFRTVEERAVTLVLSDKSILLEQPFLEEYSSYIAFQIRKKTKVIKGENITQKYKDKLQEVGKTKGIKKEEMEVRLKKGMWGYETKQVQVNQNLSREEQLNLRQKMIKDKHCW